MPETRKGSKGEISPDDALRLLLDSHKTELLNEIRKMQGTLVTLQTKMNDVEGALCKVLETQRKQDLEISALKEDMLRMREENENIMNEMEDRERRKSNLIISGVQEKEDGSVEERRCWDKEKVETLLHDLGDFDSSIVAHIHRLGKVNSRKPRLLKIICKDSDTKRSVLHRAKDLRGMPGYDRIFVNSDLTPAQQMKEKSLREDLRRRRGLGQDVMIKRGKIVQKHPSNFH